MKRRAIITLPDWVPTDDGIRETVAPFRIIPAESLICFSAVDHWLRLQKRKGVKINAAAARMAWLRWAVRQAKAAESNKPKTKPRRRSAASWIKILAARARTPKRQQTST